MQIINDKTLAHLWAPILQSMGPSLIIEAERALGYSKRLVSKWLERRMFRADCDPTKKAANIAKHVNADSENVYVSWSANRHTIGHCERVCYNATIPFPIGTKPRCKIDAWLKITRMLPHRSTI